MGTRTIATESAVVPLAMVDQVGGRLREQGQLEGHQPAQVSMAEVSEGALS